MIITTNISGVYVFNQNYKLVAKKNFTPDQARKYNKDLEEGKWIAPEKDFIKKYKNSTFIGFKNEKLGDIKISHDLKKLDEISKYFEKNALDSIREINTVLTKDAIRASVNADQFVIQSINSIGETQKVCNILAKRLREWYELHCPEFSKSISSHQKFAELIQKKNKEELLKEIKARDTMGADLSKGDLVPIKNLAKELTEMFLFLEEQEKYLKTTMEKLCPNLLAITGPLIGAKLIEAAGSLQKLVNFPAGTIQLLGAEKALFRHLKTGARAPKYGLLFDHPLILGAKEKDRGKIARHLANKISLAVRVDFYEGKFIGEELKKDLEKFADKLKSQKVKK